MTEQEFDLQLTGMANGGEALGRRDGQVVFVPYGLPGERARVRLVEAKRRYSRAEIVEVLDPSPDRVTPRCRHFGECGGCYWQHADYAAQLLFKQEIVRDALMRIGHLADVSVAETVASPQPWNYRNHVQFAVADDGSLGFKARRSHRIVPIEECHLLHPLIEELLVSLDLEFPELRQLSVRVGAATDDAMIILHTTSEDMPEIEVDLPLSVVAVPPTGLPQVLAGRGYLVEGLAGREFRIGATSFFQVNTEQAESLVRLVREALRPEPTDLLLDLYCGVGTFALAMAGEVAGVLGIEESEGAIVEAIWNSEGIDNVEFVAGKAERLLSSVAESFDLVIVDPPRAGVDKSALDALVEMEPKRIAYVSCDPAALARDARRLAEGGYRLERVTPVDMFPQTYHVESVALLER
jgi:23S rRNA (uracil1939-C5)-methyltransferase